MLVQRTQVDSQHTRPPQQVALIVISELIYAYIHTHIDEDRSEDVLREWKGGVEVDIIKIYAL